MNRHLVMSLSLYKPDGKVSSNKMAAWLAERLDAPVCARNTPPVKPAQTVWLVNSSSGFTTEEHRQLTLELCRRAKTVVYCNNDYMLPLNSKWKRASAKARVVYLTTIPRWLTHGNKEGAYLNWNQLTWEPQDVGGPRSGLIYWGACRPHREKSFVRWLTDPRISISAPTVKQVKTFAELFGDGDSERYVTLEDGLMPGLCGYAGTVFLEDDYSLRNMTSPPNRWYEALAAKLGILVPQESVASLNKAGFDVQAVCPEAILRTHVDIETYINRPQYLTKLGEKQHAVWAQDFKKLFRREFDATVKHLQLV